MMKFKDQLDAFLAPMRRRISLMVSRAVIKLVNDQGAVQLNQLLLLKDEIRDDVERFQQYGFTSVPKPGAEALVCFVGGDRQHGVVVATEDRRFRIKNLQPGEVAIYTDEGDKIHFKRDRTIEVTTQTLTVNCQTAEITASESASVDSPEVLVTCDQATVDASTSVDITSPAVTADTPLLTVTGLISCAGIGAGAPPVSGKAVVAGALEASSVKDSVGTLSALRTAYNSHVHGGSPGPTPTV